jgi:Ca2+-binding RTX toxin-like protein
MYGTMCLLIEQLENRKLFAAVSLTDGATKNTSGIEWSDNTLTVHGTHRSEMINAVAFTADQMGETIVNYSPSLTFERQINEDFISISVVRPSGDAPNGIDQESYSFEQGTGAADLQHQLSVMVPADGVLIVASRRGVVERWVVDKSLVDQVIIDAGAGNDMIGNFAAYDGGGAFQFNIPSTLLGGAGDDQLISQGDALLSGGAGNDILITSGGSRVTLSGGRGDDYLEATDPSASLDGGAGFDSVNHGAAGFGLVDIEQINTI